MDSRTEGSYEGWDEIWASQSEEGLLNPMYCEKSPENIYQFWQNCYALDLIGLAKSKSYSSFCELGSGRGTTTMYLAKEGFTDLTMVDLAEQGFRVAKHSFEHYGLAEPKMLLENVERTHLENNRFDCIYNIGLLEHFDDPEPTLSEAFRLLKKDGMIFMPIVPIQPYYKSIFQRLVFNPISLVKDVIKRIIGRNSEHKNINRTDYGCEVYTDICNKIGFSDVKCIPYNPYPKVNDDGKFLDKVVLPIYKWHYRTFKKGKPNSLKTSRMFDTCLLLTARKE